MRLANRAPGPISGKVIDPAIVTNDWAPVFRFSRAAKRVFDIVAAVVGLILLSPMFLLVSIAIKLHSNGPLFHSETLHGYNNENNIRVLKFRTTIICGHGKVLKYVTRVGAVLGRTGIDSLPLLINVLRGEMSIVGLAPYGTAPFFAEQISLIQQQQQVKLGLTGWAQVHGCCGESDNVVRQRIECDQYYIENWSFLFDIKIILMTLFSKNAYLD